LVADRNIIDESHYQLLPGPVRQHLADFSGDSSAIGRAACDYLASMTENELTLFYQTLFESTGGSPLR